MSRAFIRRAGIAGVTAIALAALAYSLWRPEGRPPMPAEIFTTVKGELITSRDLRGRVVLVDFWATDCEPCIREMPQRVAIYNDFRQYGFELVAVAMNYDRPDRVAAYAEKNELPFRVALDVQGTIARDFGGVDAIPASFLVDKRGRIVRRFTGTPDPAELRTLIEAAIKEPA